MSPAEAMPIVLTVYTLLIFPMGGFLVKLWADVQQLKRDSTREQSVHDDLKNITERLIRVEVLLDRRLPKE